MGDNKFSAQLQALRKNKGITQEQLAQAIGVTPQAVSKWENGGYPDGSLIPEIARFFGVSTDCLYGIAGDEKSVEQRVLEDIKKIHIACKGNNKREVLERMLTMVWAMVIPIWEDNEYFWNINDGKSLKQNTASLVKSDGGFALLRLNADSRFAFISSEAEDGYGKYFKYSDDICGFFAFLGKPANLKIVYYLNTIVPMNFFTAEALQTQLGLDARTVSAAIDYLVKIGAVIKSTLENGKDSDKTMIYTYRDECNYSLLMLLQGAKMTLNHIEAFQMQIGERKTPIFNADDIGILDKGTE